MRRAKTGKPNRFLFWLVSLVTRIVAKVVFRRRVLRNELKGAKGPFVVIANHQTKLDFVNLFDLAGQPVHFVISDCFYSTLPFQGVMDRLGMIPKQQFQTTLTDIRRMKSVVDEGRGLVIYPAGLMCEDGLSTPIPAATYRFLSWMRADVYVARTTGTYFVRPKWSKRNRPGRTYMDVYKLFSAEDLETLSVEEIRERADNALLFDAYREQEEHKIKYHKNYDLEGLEQVLYMCPHCKSEFSIRLKDHCHLVCEKCGFRHTGDVYGFLRNTGNVGEEVRYVSDWSRLIYEELKRKVEKGEESIIVCDADVSILDRKKKRFTEAGRAKITLSGDCFLIEGVLNGEESHMVIPTTSFASLPFQPGKYLEIQCGEQIYRCFPDNGALVMKMINMVKIYYEIHTAIRFAPQ